MNLDVAETSRIQHPELVSQSMELVTGTIETEGVLVKKDLYCLGSDAFADTEEGEPFWIVTLCGMRHWHWEWQIGPHGPHPVVVPFAFQLIMSIFGGCQEGDNLWSHRQAVVVDLIAKLARES